MTVSKDLVKCLMKIPLCGCGDPDEVLCLLRDVLAAFVDRPAGATLDWASIMEVEDGHPLMWLAFYVLSESELTEHGGNVSGSWASVTGKELAAAWKDIPADQLSDWVFDRISELP